MTIDNALEQMMADIPDQVWMAGEACPDCDVESSPGADDDDFHGCEDCNDVDDFADDVEGVTEDIADIAEAILAESELLIDHPPARGRLEAGLRVLPRNASVNDLIKARRAAVGRR